jgi:hypothetical protein
MQALVRLSDRQVVALGEWSADPVDPDLVLVTLTPAQEAALAAPGVKYIAENGEVTVIPVVLVPTIGEREQEETIARVRRSDPELATLLYGPAS